MAHPGGRPTDLTPDLINEVKRLLPTALYLETVADYMGVDRYSFRKWIKRGGREQKRLRKGKEPIPAEAIYAEFVAAIKKALAEGEIHAVGVLKRATQVGQVPISRKTTTRTAADGTTTTTVEEKFAEPQWTAAAVLMERRWPHHWGRDRDLFRQLLKDVAELKERTGNAEPYQAPGSNGQTAKANRAPPRP